MYHLTGGGAACAAGRYCTRCVRLPVLRDPSTLSDALQIQLAERYVTHYLIPGADALPYRILMQMLEYVVAPPLQASAVDDVALQRYYRAQLQAPLDVQSTRPLLERYFYTYPHALRQALHTLEYRPLEHAPRTVWLTLLRATYAVDARAAHALGQCSVVYRCCSAAHALWQEIRVAAWRDTMRAALFAFLLLHLHAEPRHPACDALSAHLAARYADLTLEDLGAWTRLSREQCALVESALCTASMPAAHNNVLWHVLCQHSVPGDAALARRLLPLERDAQCARPLDACDTPQQLPLRAIVRVHYRHTASAHAPAQALWSAVGTRDFYRHAQRTLDLEAQRLLYRVTAQQQQHAMAQVGDGTRRLRVHHWRTMPSMCALLRLRVYALGELPVADPSQADTDAAHRGSTRWCVYVALDAPPCFPL